MRIRFFFKVVRTVWIPAGVYPAEGGAGMTSYYESIHFDGS